jgi:predicted flap endonuclease-1-like 5' DNA nuclease
MSLLEKLKSLLGFGGGRDTSPDSTGSTVTVEREPSAESEHAVKGTGDIGDEREEADDVDAEATEVEAEAGEEEPEPSEAAEVAEPEAEDEETKEEPEATEAEKEAGESEAAGEGGAATLEEIDGIGPTYAERLESAGIETVADLTSADPDAVADAAEAGESRAENWIEQATER